MGRYQESKYTERNTMSDWYCDFYLRNNPWDLEPRMEVFQAKFDYVKQRKDVISFRKGDKFYIIDKPNDEWWSARKLSDDSYGYVPAIYLEVRWNKATLSRCRWGSIPAAYVYDIPLCTMKWLLMLNYLSKWMIALCSVY